MHTQATKTAELELDFFDVRHRAFTIATISVAIVGLAGVVVHFITKGISYWGVPFVGITGLCSLFVALFLSRKYRSVQKGGAFASITSSATMMLLIIFTDGLRSSLLPLICGLPGFAALFWGPRGALWTLGSTLSLLALLGAAEWLQLMPHAYFGPYPELQNAAFFLSVFNSLMMVGATGVSYVREQNSIRSLIFNQSKKAREAEEMKSKFLANMTHELRTPLNGISGITSLLELHDLEEKSQQYLKMIKESAAELETLIENLLIAAASEGSVNVETVSIAQLLTNVSFNPNHFQIDSEHCEQLVTIPVNTVSNILQLISKAALSRSHTRPVKIKIDHDNIKTRILIEDQGETLSNENFRKLMHSFDRTTNSSGTISSNAQLGLGFAEELAHRIGGKFEYQQGPQNCFCLTLPLIQ